MGEEGCVGDSSLLYRRNIPPAIVDASPWQLPDLRIKASDLVVGNKK
jgi:homogentisate 1,2-dioxygenase